MWRGSFEGRLLALIFVAALATVTNVWPDRRKEDVVSRVVAQLKSGDSNERSQGMGWVMRLGPSADAVVPVLISRLDPDDFEIINALLRVGPRATLPGLTAALEGSDQKRAAAALIVIGGFGPAAAAAKPAVMKALELPQLRSAASGTLRRVEGEVDDEDRLPGAWRNSPPRR